MNPPYGRIRLTPIERERWEHVLHGHANRYALFLASAVEQLPETGGVLTALVPAGWLGGAYFQRLRDVLAHKAPLTDVGFVGDRSGVFATTVLQETVLATMVTGSKGGAAVRCEQLGIDRGEVARKGVGSGRLPVDRSRPWLLPRRTEDLSLIKAASAMSGRLVDYDWSVSTGPLVWNRHKDQISAHHVDGAAPVVWAADIEGGRLRQSEARRAQRFLRFANDRQRTIFALEQPAVLVQRTTAPEQPRRLVAAEVDQATLDAWGGRIVVENHVNVLRCDDADSPLTTHILVALLDSPEFDRLYRCLTGSVAVSAYELGSLPLPDAKTLRRWGRLSALGLRQAITRAYGGAS